MPPPSPSLDGEQRRALNIDEQRALQIYGDKLYKTCICRLTDHENGSRIVPVRDITAIILQLGWEWSHDTGGDSHYRHAVLRNWKHSNSKGKPGLHANKLRKSFGLSAVHCFTCI